MALNTQKDSLILVAIYFINTSPFGLNGQLDLQGFQVAMEKSGCPFSILVVLFLPILTALLQGGPKNLL